MSPSPTSGASPRRWPFLMAVAALLLPAFSGCSHHKRTALRPVYASPAVVAPSPCPSGNCGGGAAATTTTTITPGFDDGGISRPSSPSARPISPPKSGVDGEPQLSPIAPTSSVKPSYGSPPSTSRKINRGAPTRTALKAGVEPFVDDAGDLFAPPKADRPWKYVVLHHSATPAGSYAQIDRDHRQARGFTGCGYHFVIGNGTESPDGQIEVATRWADQKGGAHCRDAKSADVNEYGIGICLIGNFDGTEPTPRQIQATRALVAYLKDRYEIPADRVGTHEHVAQGPTACPGRQFPTAAILADRDLAAR